MTRGWLSSPKQLSIHHSACRFRSSFKFSAKLSLPFQSYRSNAHQAAHRLSEQSTRAREELLTGQKGCTKPEVLPPLPPPSANIQTSGPSEIWTLNRHHFYFGSTTEKKQRPSTLVWSWICKVACCPFCTNFMSNGGWSSLFSVNITKENQSLRSVNVNVRKARYYRILVA